MLGVMFGTVCAVLSTREAPFVKLLRPVLGIGGAVLRTIDIVFGTEGALCLEFEVLCFGLFILGRKKLCIKEALCFGLCLGIWVLCFRIFVLRA